MKKTILVTGGAGFIGSNFVRLALASGKYKVVNLDALTYAGNLENLADLENRPDYVFRKASICDRSAVEALLTEYNFAGIINFAAESHVDRSIMSAAPFLETNVFGTLVLLEESRKRNIGRYLQVSTDEVYGSLGAVGKFDENHKIDPKSPYSASKASADHFVLSFVNTYDFPALITRCSNNYGPYQFPEKLIPLVIQNALSDRNIPVYGDGMNVRDWIYVDDHCRAILDVFERGETGRVYNVGADEERTNIEIVKTILGLLGKPESLITFVKDRPGHDKRYAMDSTRISTELGWRPQIDFAEGMRRTVDWYTTNRDWTKKIISGEYVGYYEKQYSDR